MDDSASQLLPRSAAHASGIAVTAAFTLAASRVVLTPLGMEAAWWLTALYIFLSAPAVAAELSGRRSITPAAINKWARNAFLLATAVALSVTAASPVMRAQTPATIAACIAAIVVSWLSAVLRGRARDICAAQLVVTALVVRHVLAASGALLLGKIWGASGVAIALMVACLGELVVLAQPSVLAPSATDETAPTGLLSAAMLFLWAFPVADLILAVHVVGHHPHYSIASALPRVAALMAGLLVAAPAISAYTKIELAEVAKRRAATRALVPSLVAAVTASALVVAMSWATASLAILCALTAVVLVQLMVVGSWALIHTPIALILCATILVASGSIVAVLAPIAEQTLAFATLVCTATAWFFLFTTSNAVARLQLRPRLVSPADVVDQNSAVQISVVLPAYNPGLRVLETVRGVHSALSDLEHEVILVDDGSTDGSCDFDPISENVTVVRKPNGGKGTALAAGLSVASGVWVAFVDSDGDIDPKHVRAYLDIAMDKSLDGVVGSKRAAGAKVDVSFLRQVSSWGFQTLVRLALNTKIRDTQVGCKCVRGDMIREVLPDMTERGFLFDLELLALLTNHGARLEEAPVTIESRIASTVRTSTVLTMLRGTLLLALARTSATTTTTEPTSPIQTVVAA